MCRPSAAQRAHLYLPTPYAVGYFWCRPSGPAAVALAHPVGDAEGPPRGYSGVVNSTALRWTLASTSGTVPSLTATSFGRPCTRKRWLTCERAGILSASVTV